MDNNNDKTDEESVHYGVVIENFCAGEVGTIVLDFADNLLYKIPASYECRFKPGTNVIFCTAPQSNIILQCDTNKNFFSINDTLKIEENGITMNDTVIFSNEEIPRVYSQIVGYLNFDQEQWSEVMPNVPYNAVIEMNIDYGMGGVFCPETFKLATFNPKVEFWLYGIDSVNMLKIDNVRLMEWNKKATNNLFATIPHLIVDKETEKFGEVTVENNSRQIKKVRKDKCIVLEPNLFYSSEGNLISNPLPGSFELGTYGQVTYYRCKFNKTRVAGKVNPIGSVPVRHSSSGPEFLLNVGKRRNGFYSNVYVPIINDTKSLLKRIDTITSPKPAWVSYDGERDIFSRFTVVEVPKKVDTKKVQDKGMLESIESFGFIKDLSGQVYCPDYFDVEFRLAKDLMGKHTLGDCIEFKATYRHNKNCFVIKSTTPGAHYTRLTVGSARAKNGKESYVFQVPLGRVSTNMLQSDAMGLIEDPTGEICHSLSSAPVELFLRTFWVAFDPSGLVPLRVITEKDEVLVKEITDKVSLYLELPENYYDSDDEMNPMLRELADRFR